MTTLKFKRKFTFSLCLFFIKLRFKLHSVLWFELCNKGNREGLFSLATYASEVYTGQEVMLWSLSAVIVVAVITPS